MSARDDYPLLHNWSTERPDDFRSPAMKAALAELDRLRAEVEWLQMRLFEDVTAARIELLTEVQALRAEAKRLSRRLTEQIDLNAALAAHAARMRPVIEAAGVWFDEDDALEAVSDWLAVAVARYRIAVAALDAGEQP